jgi:hypothetical protein
VVAPVGNLRKGRIADLPRSNAQRRPGARPARGLLGCEGLARTWGLGAGRDARRFSTRGAGFDFGSGREERFDRTSRLERVDGFDLLFGSLRTLERDFEDELDRGFTSRPDDEFDRDRLGSLIRTERRAKSGLDGGA